MNEKIIVEVDYKGREYSYTVDGVNYHTLHEARYGTYGDFLTNLIIDLFGHKRETVKLMKIVLTPEADVRIPSGEKGVLSRLEVMLNNLQCKWK
jgi:hypothetical protein